MLHDIGRIVCDELKKSDLQEWGYWATIFYYAFMITILILPFITIALEEGLYPQKRVNNKR